LVIDRVPSVEIVRMVSSGTEATMSALRLARGYTGPETCPVLGYFFQAFNDPVVRVAQNERPPAQDVVDADGQLRHRGDNERPASGKRIYRPQQNFEIRRLLPRPTSVDAPKLVPFSATFFRLSTTRSFVWPKMSGPQIGH
jgi:hypothetical protein